MKKAKKITKIWLFVITALVVLLGIFPHVVKASQESQNENTSAVITENKTTKKERKAKKGISKNKAKFENLTDEEKEALKAKRDTKKTEKKAKYENITDEEKEALKNKKPEKKERKNNNVENSQNAEQ